MNTGLELRDRAGSPGSAGGLARVVGGEESYAEIRLGDVVVTKTADPKLVPFLADMAGLVTEFGGVTAHLVVMARARNVPAVVGVAQATSKLTPGSWVSVDGSRGRVVAQPQS